jgi:uncharacterized protein (DUF1501 family)
MIIKSSNRRQFLKNASALSVGVPLLSTIAQQAQAAGPFNDYKAIVCIFLYGGNDSHNNIISLPQYSTYQSIRGNLALPQSSMIDIGTANGAGDYRFHPALTGLANRFKQGKLAVVNNVGVLLGPTSKADYDARRNLPPQLFSHSDMQSHWQTALPDQPSKTGWGGRMSDTLALAGANPNTDVSLAVNFSGNSIMLRADTITPLSISPWSTVSNKAADFANRANNPFLLRAMRSWDNWAASRPNPQAILDEQINPANRTHLMEKHWADTAQRINSYGDELFDVFGQTLEAPGFDDNVRKNGLARQLERVFRVVSSYSNNKVPNATAKRHVFFVSLGGFDNHGDQFQGTQAFPTGPAGSEILGGLHYQLLNTLDVALDKFYGALETAGLADRVTTFTATDFGRTLKSNGKGSDHGWGGHQFVIGGKVNGGKLYGAFPNLAKGSPDDAGEGRLIPKISVEEYCATFAKWMGLSDAELNTVFPYMPRFANRGLPGLVNA